jgi:hypothetical protein
MSTQEAIELLAHGSGLDSVAVSPTMIEVSKLCGKTMTPFLNMFEHFLLFQT